MRTDEPAPPPDLELTATPVGPGVRYLPVLYRGARFEAVNFSRVMADDGLQRHLRAFARDATFLRQRAAVEIDGRLYEAEVLRYDAVGEQALVEVDEDGVPFSARHRVVLRFAEEYCAWVERRWGTAEGLTPDTGPRLLTDFVEPALVAVRVSRGRVRAGGRIPYADVARSPRLVVLAGAGSGKTTLLRKLTLDLALRAGSAPDAAVPVHVPLRDLRDGGFGRHAVETILARHGGGQALTALRSRVGSGGVALFLDGLDELAPAARPDALAAVEDICAAWPNVRVVLTTRPTAYPRALRGFTHVRIEPFDTHRIARWSWRYCAAADPATAARTFRRLRPLLFSQPEMTELAGNPLLLSLVVSRFVRYGVTPRHKAVLLGACLDTLLVGWDAVRGVVRDGQRHLLPAPARALLQELAVRQDCGPDDVAALTAPLGWTTGRTGRALELLAELGLLRAGTDGGPALAVAPPAVRDYLAAGHLLARPQPAADAFAGALDDEEGRRRWLLACGLAGDASELLHLLLDAESDQLGLLDRVGLVADALAQGCTADVGTVERCHHAVRAALDAALAGTAVSWSSRRAPLLVLSAADGDAADGGAADGGAADGGPATGGAGPGGGTTAGGEDSRTAVLRRIAQDGLLWRLNELRHVPAGARLFDLLRGSSQPGVRRLAHLFRQDGELAVSWDAERQALVVALDRPAADRGTLPAPRASADPPAELVAVTAPDGALRLADPRSGVQVRALGHFPGLVRSAAFGSRGLVVAAGRDGVVRVWGPTTGDRPQVLGGHLGPVHGVAVSPDGHVVAAAGSDGTVRTWDARSGRAGLVLQGHVGEVRCVAFTPDGRRLVSGGAEGTIRLWDLATGTPGPGLLPTGSRSVESLSVHPSGALLAAGGSDGVLEIWTLDEARVLHRVSGQRGPVDGIAFSREGDRLAGHCAAENSLRVWAVPEGRLVVSFTGRLFLGGGAGRRAAPVEAG